MLLDNALEVLHLLENHLDDLCLTPEGEPLLYQHLERVIREAKKTIPRVHFATNGFLLTPQRCDSLADAGLDHIAISIDSLDPDTFHTLRGARLDILLSNIEYFSNCTKLPIGIISVLHQQSIAELTKFLHLKERIPTLQNLTFLLLNTEDNQSVIDHYEDLVVDPAWTAFLEEARLSDIQVSLPRKQTSTGCPIPKEELFIDIKGNLSLCCQLPVTGGNVLTDGLHKAACNHEFKTWRDRICSGVYHPKCRQCALFYCHKHETTQS